MLRGNNVCVYNTDDGEILYASARPYVFLPVALWGGGHGEKVNAYNIQDVIIDLQDSAGEYYNEVGHYEFFLPNPLSFGDN